MPKPKDDVKDLTEAFNAMLDHLNSSFEKQRQFASDAAHELRTPLSVLRTNLDIAMSADDTPSTDFRISYRSFDESLRRMERLVDDLLLLANEETLSASSEHIFLGPLLEEVYLELGPMATEYRVTLRLEGNADVAVAGDATLLGRAFSNLIENAIRYNLPGGSVTVGCSSNEDTAYVRISDTGVGVAPDAQAHIFDRFYREDHSRSRASGGTGLGLAIVKQIVDAHRGKISLSSSTPESGSTFTVALPLAPRQENAEHE